MNSDCLHCQVGALLKKRREERAPEAEPRMDVISALCQVVAELALGTTPALREQTVASTVATLIATVAAVRVIKKIAEEESPSADGIAPTCEGSNSIN